MISLGSIFAVEIPVDQRRRVAWFTLYYFLLFFAFYMSKVLRQSWFVSDLGAIQLPFGYLLVAVGTYPFLKAYSFSIRRWPFRKVLVITHVFFGFVFILFFGLFKMQWEYTSLFFYLGVAVVFGVSISQFWFHAGRSFSPRLARQVFGLLAAGGSLGGVLGAQAVPIFGQGPYALIFCCLICVMLLMVSTKFDCKESQAEKDESPPIEGNVFRRSLKKPYLVKLTLLTFVSVFCAQVVDLQFTWVVENVDSDPGKQQILFAHFYSLISVVALLLQLFFTSRVYRKLGISWGMRILPSSILMGSLSFFAVTILQPVLTLWVGFTMKLLEGGVRHSFEQVSRELLFLPLPDHMRQRVKAFLDIMVQRLAKGIAGVALLTVTIGWITPIQTTGITFTIVIFWLWLTYSVKKDYLLAYRKKISKGKQYLTTDLVGQDAATIEILVGALAHADGDFVLRAIEILRVYGKTELISPFLVYHKHAGVRSEILKILEENRPEHCQDLVVSCLSDPDPQIRTLAAQTLSRYEGKNVTEVMEGYLNHESAQVRGVAAVCLLRGNHLAEQAEQVLQTMLCDESAKVRIEAIKTLCQLPEPMFSNNILLCLHDQNDDVVDQAINTVGARISLPCEDYSAVIYIPKLISLLGEHRFRYEARQTLWKMGKVVAPALVHFLQDVNENSSIRRAIPKTIAGLPSDEAAGILVEDLHQKNPFFRRSIISSLPLCQGVEKVVLRKRDLISQALYRECKAYSQHLVDFFEVGGIPHRRDNSPMVYWDQDQALPGLFEQLLSERMRENILNIFDLLKLLYPFGDIEAIKQVMVSGAREEIDAGMEILDTLLRGNERQWVLNTWENITLSTKKRVAFEVFGIAKESREDILIRYMQNVEDGDLNSLCHAAILSAGLRPGRKFLPILTKLSTHGVNPRIRETAQFVLARYYGALYGNKETY